MLTIPKRKKIHYLEITTPTKIEGIETKLKSWRKAKAWWWRRNWQETCLISHQSHQVQRLHLIVQACVCAQRTLSCLCPRGPVRIHLPTILCFTKSLEPSRGGLKDTGKTSSDSHGNPILSKCLTSSSPYSTFSKSKLETDNDGWWRDIFASITIEFYTWSLAKAIWRILFEWNSSHDWLLAAR